MNFNENDIFRMLKIQAKTLQTVSDSIDDLQQEVQRQREFVALLYRQLKRDIAEQRSVTEILENLPDNVLLFPEEK